MKLILHGSLKNTLPVQSAFLHICGHCISSYQPQPSTTTMEYSITSLAPQKDLSLATRRCDQVPQPSGVTSNPNASLTLLHDCPLEIKGMLACLSPPTRSLRYRDFHAATQSAFSSCNLTPSPYHYHPPTIYHRLKRKLCHAALGGFNTQ